MSARTGSSSSGVSGSSLGSSISSTVFHSEPSVASALGRPTAFTIAAQPTTTTSLLSATASLNVTKNASRHSTPVVTIVVAVVLAVFGLISFGILLFLCIRKRRKQQSAEQPETPCFGPSSATDRSRSSSLHDRDVKAPWGDSAVDLTTRPKMRSSRASSSIFLADDTTTITSPTHNDGFLRPISLGEPVTPKSMQGAHGQMLTLPEEPVPLTADTKSLRSVPRRVDSLPSADQPMHIVTITRPTTPEVTSPTPLLPAQLPPLPPVPPISHSFVAERSKRDSTHTLAPSRYGGPSRPLSMASVYSTRTQATEVPEALTPDMLEVLNRLKRRISTPWSVNSVGTDRTERMSVMRASVEN